MSHRATIMNIMMNMVLSFIFMVQRSTYNIYNIYSIYSIQHQHTCNMQHATDNIQISTFNRSTVQPFNLPVKLFWASSFFVILLSIIFTSFISSFSKIELYTNTKIFSKILKKKWPDYWKKRIREEKKRQRMKEFEGLKNWGIEGVRLQRFSMLRYPLLIIPVTLFTLFTLFTLHG